MITYYMFVLVVFCCLGELNIKMRIIIFLLVFINVLYVVFINILSCGFIILVSLGGILKKIVLNFVRFLMVLL